MAEGICKGCANTCTVTREGYNPLFAGTYAGKSSEPHRVSTRFTYCTVLHSCVVRDPDDGVLVPITECTHFLPKHP